MSDFKNKRVTVLGLGRFGGGIGVARWLSQQGAHVTVTDRDGPDKLADSVKKLAGLPITFRLGESVLEDFTQTDLVVTSPAVKPSHELLLAAEDAGVPVTTEICLFWERCDALLIGVTGTKGKSTTASMIAHILRAQRPCFLGGNIGGSLLEKLDEINRSGAPVVLELSSFMLHWLGQARSSPAVAVMTMLSTDHLDWHGTADAYIDAKRNITRFQLPGETLVRRGDPVSRTFVAPAGVRLREYPDARVRPFDLVLPGAHNAANAQAAYLAVEAPGVLTWDHAQAALRTFIGLAHRLQLVHDAGGVRYFNDSIATIPEAAVIASDSFEKGRVIQIVGGAVKEGLSWDAMCDHLAARCKKVLTIGTIGPALAKRCGVAGEYVATLETAVLRAKELAQPGDVVLLSPGTASYDQFANYEKRGEAFANFARSN